MLERLEGLDSDEQIECLIGERKLGAQRRR